MSTMLISPIQPNKDYVTSGEFRDHDQYMRDGFEKVFEQADNVEIHLIQRLDKLEANTNKRFDTVDTRLNVVDKRLNGIDKRLDGVDGRLDGIDKKLNIIDKKFNNIDRKIDNITNLLVKKS